MSPSMPGVLSRLVTGLAGATGLRRTPRASTLPLTGYTDHRHDVAFVDDLSDEDLTELNRLLPWRAFTVDRNGRRLGNVAWQGKRDRPEAVPDRRIAMMHDRFGLAGQRVLEVGCFEGIHTVGLSLLGARVTAIDARIENVVKTIVRAALYDCHPRVFKYDVDRVPADAERLEAELLHHVGVLYHLQDPVRHLLDLGRYIRRGLMLDTHYAEDGEADQTYAVDGATYRYRRYHELGRADVFSGMYEHSKWLLLDTIVDLLRRAGFAEVEVVERRQERNGPRLLLFATRAP
jgi:2-polyprenyl-3-methyl-5-hydroxy-6-metoxy-1,4-benzoquinol methylase